MFVTAKLQTNIHPSQDFGAGAPAALDGSDPRRPEAGQLLGHRFPRAAQSGSSDDRFWKSTGHETGKGS